jgi:hypothetical protein
MRHYGTSSVPFNKSRWRMKNVPSVHPHAEAAYRIFPLGESGFAVEVSIPGTHPTKVLGLQSQIAAEAWIERHKRQIATGTIKRPRIWRTAV